MSTLKVNTIQDTTGNDALTIDSSGNVTASQGFVPSTQLSHRNMIINGDMRVAQRGTSATGVNTSGYKTVDRLNIFAGSGTWTQTQSTDAPNGFSNSLKMQCTTANASPSSSAFLIMGYKIEGQDLQRLAKGTSDAKSCTISFWIKSNKTGNYIFELQDIDNTRQISKTYTINTADTWEYKSITIDGDTTGSFDNDSSNSLQVNWWLSAGTNYTSGTLSTSWSSTTNANRVVGGTNLADSTSNYINITGVQLEVGSVATPFENRSYGEELARCFRYYQRLGDNKQTVIGTAAYPSSTNFRAAYFLKTEMRTSPSFTSSSGSNHFRIYDGTSRYMTSLALDVSAPEVMGLRSGGGLSGGTQGNAGLLLMDANADSHLIFDAEL